MYRNIMILWFFINIQKLLSLMTLTQIQAFLYLFIKQRDKKVPSLLYKVSHASNPTSIFQDGGADTCVNCQSVIYYHALLIVEINDFKAV